MSFADPLDGKTVDIPDKKAKAKSTARGCDGCPLNKEGCVKVIGLARVTGKKIMLWAQAPGYRETQYVYQDAEGRKRRGMELVGPTGEFFWNRARTFGIDREDCDIQNIVRCRPTVWDATKQRDFDRKPTKEEIRHCSIYTEKALEKNAGKAKVHIVLGLVAAAALLGREFRKDHTIFWSDKFNAKVICIAHPAYFLREGYAKSKLQEFMAGLKAAAEIFKGGDVSRFAYVESQDFKAITRTSDLNEEAERIKEASKKTRISFDIEDGPRGDGRVILCIGFSYKPGVARTVYLDKTDVKIQDRNHVIQTFERLFTDEDIRWIAQHGVHDTRQTKKILGFPIKNFDYDTQYAEYLAYSNRRSYSLAEIAEVRFPQYAGYKDMIIPYVGESDQFDGTLDYDKIPHTVMTPYNGTDASLTKEIELSTYKKINLALLHVYMDVAFVFDDMNRTGPLLDLEHYETVEAVLPDKIKRIQERLAIIALKPKFNPGSHIQVRELLYKTLGLDPVLNKKGKPGTDANVLAFLKQFHEAPALIDDYRKLAKMETTYLKGFKRSAELYNGELRTIWWVTGTVTGRLRSGKGKKIGKKKTEGIVNLQNIHGDPLIKNLLVSDLRWRRILGILDDDPELRKKIRLEVKADIAKRVAKAQG